MGPRNSLGAVQKTSFLYLLGIEAGFFDRPDRSLATIHHID